MPKVTKAQSYRKSGEVMGGVTQIYNENNLAQQTAKKYLFFSFFILSQKYRYCLQTQIHLLMFDTQGFSMGSFIFSITNKYNKGT